MFSADDYRHQAKAMTFEVMPEGYLPDVIRARAAIGADKSLLIHFDYSGDVNRLKASATLAGVECRDMFGEFPWLDQSRGWRFAMRFPHNPYVDPQQAMVYFFGNIR